MSLTDPVELHWLVCHTKPRCEKKFASMLSTEAVEHYLPLVETVRRYRSKTERYQKPLFPGYVFVNSSDEMRPRLYQRDFLVRYLPVKHPTTFLKQLDDVRLVVASGLTLMLHPLLKKGTRVKVKSGPLYGVEGVVNDPTKPSGIVVAIDVLQQGVLVKLPLEILEPIL